MSLSEKLNLAIEKSSTGLCKVGALLFDKKLSEKDREILKSVLNADLNDPARVPNAVLAKILREEGHDVSNSAVDRHRRAECACKRIETK